MTGPDDIIQLRAMALKARILARSSIDPITVDTLNHYAEECEAQVRVLEASGGPS